MYYREIIVIDSDAVISSILIIAFSENSMLIKLEEEFIRMCKENDEGFDDNNYNAEDISMFLEDGIYEFGYGSVVIREPYIIYADEQ